METSDLESYLHRPLCPCCGKARVRPVDIHRNRLAFRCPAAGCDWRGSAALPNIRKTVIYLDTSTVSHMARALRNGDDQSPWLLLYHALRDAAAREVLCCPGSSVVRMEADLCEYAAEINEVARGFGDPGLKGQLDIRHAQLFRALERFLAGEAARLETVLDRSEAFREDVNRWLPVYDISVNMTTPDQWIQSRRRAKGKIRDDVKDFYGRYGAEALSFEAIRDREAASFGPALVEARERSIWQGLGIEPVRDETELVSAFIPDAFDQMIYILRERRELSYPEAAAKAEEFLLSDHVKLTPIADTMAKLHAGLAMLYRGPHPRSPKPGDGYDIDHIATFVPYVDVFIADRFFADLCNQNHMLVGKPYRTQIRSLGEKEIESFVEELVGLVRKAPQAQLADRVMRVMEQGAAKRWPNH